MAGDASGRQRTILVIEDDRASRLLFRSVLAKLPDVRILLASDGHSGLELARTDPPDLVVLDLQLPDVDGDEVLRRLRRTKATAKVPVLVVSADATTPRRRRAVAAGATDVLLKPIDVPAFLRVAGGLLPGGRSASHLRLAASPDTKPLRLHEAVAAASPVAIVAVDAEGLVRLWNPAAEGMLGWSSEEMLGQPLRIPEHEVEAFEQQHARALAGEMLRGVEAVRCRKDGSLVDVRISLTPWQEPGSAAAGTVAVISDVGRRRRTDTALRKRSEELSILHETALALIRHRSAADTLETIVTEAARLVDTPGGFLYLVDSDSGTLTLRVGVGPFSAYVGVRLARGEGMAGQVFATGKPLSIDDYRSWEERSQVFADLDVGGVAAVPLRTQQAVVGVLGVAVEAGRALTESDLDLVERFGRLASLALENARLIDELAAGRNELEALLASEQEARGLLAAIVEGSPLSIVATDVDLRVTMWNPAAERIFGWSAEETLGRRPPHVPRDVLFAPNGAHERALAGRSEIISDAVRLRKDGSTLDAKVFLAPMRDRDGAVVGVMGLTQDVTEQKRAERELRDSHERLALALDAASMGTWERRNDSIDPIWSPELERLYGLEVGTFPNRHEDFLELVHPDDRERVDRMVREALATGKDLAVEFRIIRADGEVRWLLTRGKRLGGAPGEGRWLGVHVDITDQKRSEQELLRLEERHRTLVEQIPAVTFVAEADPAGQLLYLSPQAETLLGVPSETWVGDQSFRLLEFIHPDDRNGMVGQIAEEIDESGGFDVTVRVRTRDGRDGWFREIARVMDVDGQTPLLHGVLFDITEQKQAQEQLEESLAELERADEQRELLLSRLVRAQEDERQRIATDIHDDSIQVLTALALRLDMLGERADDAMRATIDEAADTARRAVARLRHLIFELHPPALDRDGLATALRTMLQELEEQLGISTTFHDRLETEPEAAVRAILYRIVQEAVVNAAKHARPKRVTVALEGSGDGHRAVVTDDGVGFDVERHEQQLGHVGLSSMRERAELARGSCEIVSTPGLGTTVEVFIPAGAAR